MRKYIHLKELCSDDRIPAPMVRQRAIIFLMHYAPAEIVLKEKSYNSYVPCTKEETCKAAIQEMEERGYDKASYMETFRGMGNLTKESEKWQRVEDKAIASPEYRNKAGLKMSTRQRILDGLNSTMTASEFLNFVMTDERLLEDPKYAPHMMHFCRPDGDLRTHDKRQMAFALVFYPHHEADYRAFIYGTLGLVILAAIGYVLEKASPGIISTPAGDFHEYLKNQGGPAAVKAWEGLKSIPGWIKDSMDFSGIMTWAGQQWGNLRGSSTPPT